MFGIGFAIVERFCHEKTQGFSLRKIQSDLSFHSEWTIPPLTDEEKEIVEGILSQPYHFMNSGGECYVFRSKDGKYVLKFFKHHHMRTKSFFDLLLPASFANHRREKLHTLFSSCKLAYDRFKKETGLLYLHLNKTHDLKTKLTLFDPIGVVHKIDLDTYEFALQKRAAMAYPTLGALAEAQEFHAAQVRIASFVDLIGKRCRRGIADHDARKRNFGFIGEEAVEIDLGSFRPDENLKLPYHEKKVLLLETGRLRQWLSKNHAELVEYLDQTVNDYLKNIE